MLRVLKPILPALGLAAALFAAPAHAAVVTYTDAAAFNAAAAPGTLFTENFDTRTSAFAANSSGNAIGSGITVDLIGGLVDAGPTRVRNNGFFEAEVDSSDVLTSDGLSLNFNLGQNVFGFALSGLQNDSRSRANRLDLEELTFVVNGERFILSDVLGLSDFSGGTTTSGSFTGGPVFVGFRSDVAFNSFQIVHTGNPDTGNNEEFWVDAIVVAVVPAPASLPILLGGLLALGCVASRRRR